MTKRVHDRDFWEKAVRELQTSGESVGEVARRYGVAPSALGWWRMRLQRKDHDALSIVPLRIAGGSERIRISVGDVSVEVPEGADPRYVVALIRAFAS